MTIDHKGDKCYAVCIHCGYRECRESGYYSDPVGYPPVGWGGSYFEYRCARCHALVEFRDGLCWYGPDDQLRPVPSAAAPTTSPPASATAMTTTTTNETASAAAWPVT